MNISERWTFRKYVTHCELIAEVGAVHQPTEANVDEYFIKMHRNVEKLSGKVEDVNSWRNDGFCRCQRNQKS